MIEDRGLCPLRTAIFLESGEQNSVFQAHIVPEVVFILLFFRRIVKFRVGSCYENGYFLEYTHHVGSNSPCPTIVLCSVHTALLRIRFPIVTSTKHSPGFLPRIQTLLLRQQLLCQLITTGQGYLFIYFEFSFLKSVLASRSLCCKSQFFLRFNIYFFTQYDSILYSYLQALNVYTFLCIFRSPYQPTQAQRLMSESKSSRRLCIGEGLRQSRRCVIDKSRFFFTNEERSRILYHIGGKVLGKLKTLL